MPYFGNKSQTVIPSTSMELCPSDRLVTQLDNWYDGDHTFNVVEIVENQDPEFTIDTIPNNVLFHHTEGDKAYIQGIEQLEKLGTVLHCNKEWTQGQYFDYWLFDYKTRIDDLNIQLNDAHDLKPSYLCLNGRPDVHRYLTLHYLIKNKLFDKGYISFLNRYGQITNKTNWDNFMNIVGDTSAILKRIFFDRKLLLLDKSDNELARNDRDHSFHLYDNTSISLVTETYCDNDKGTFITEKTWKPIANCHIPIYIGGTQILNHLREKGYDTFDDVVDNSYENENDYVLRIQRAIKALEDLLIKIEKNKLNNDEIKERLSNNKKLFLKEKITKRAVNKWIKK